MRIPRKFSMKKFGAPQCGPRRLNSECRVGAAADHQQRVATSQEDREAFQVLGDTRLIDADFVEPEPRHNKLDGRKCPKQARRVLLCQTNWPPYQLEKVPRVDLEPISIQNLRREVRRGQDVALDKADVLGIRCGAKRLVLEASGPDKGVPNTR